MTVSHKRALIISKLLLYNGVSFWNQIHPYITVTLVFYCTNALRVRKDENASGRYFISLCSGNGTAFSFSFFSIHNLHCEKHCIENTAETKSTEESSLFCSF